MNEYLQELFYKANAADYSVKREWFYPLKDKLLKFYGTQDGWDLQVIEKECWDCHGTGIDDWHDGDECVACDGTGVYQRRQIRLDRYQLGDRVYHIPEGETSVTEGYKDRIEGFIKHDAIESEEGWTACKILMNWYSAVSGTVEQREFLEHKNLSVLEQVLVKELLDEDGECRAAVLGTPHQERSKPIYPSKHIDIIRYVNDLILDIELYLLNQEPHQPLDKERFDLWHNKLKPKLEKDIERPKL